MKRLSRIHICLAAVVVLSAILLGFWLLPLRTGAYSSEDQIRSQLEDMGYADAVRVESRDETLVDEHFLCYSSDEHQLRFFFEEVSGVLRWVDTFQADAGEIENGVSTLSGVITEEERLSQSRSWAELFLDENRIGELVMEETEGNEVVFREYYEDQPTGTSVTVIWKNGAMTSTITYVGEIFERNAQGQVVPKNEGEMMSQEEAIELGLKYLAPYTSGYTLDQDTIRCELKIFRGEWTYQVRVESELDENGFNSAFTAVLDPWSGELVETRKSL